MEELSGVDEARRAILDLTFRAILSRSRHSRVGFQPIRVSASVSVARGESKRPHGGIHLCRLDRRPLTEKADGRGERHALVAIRNG